MKKIAFLALLLIMTRAVHLAGCSIEIVGPDPKVKLNQTVTVTVQVDRPHRNCPLEITDTRFETTDLSIKHKSAWQETAPNSFQIELKVKITGKNAALKVIRECPKRGTAEETARFQVG